MNTSKQAKIGQVAVAAGLLLSYCLPAVAQTSTLRNPLIPGAIWTPANSPAPEFLPPPPGCGPTPYPVNPGMGGEPGPEPSAVDIPPTPVNDKDAVNGYLGGSLTPPNSTPGSDPGNLAPNNSGVQPPAADVQVNDGGGLPAGGAPESKWGGQTSQDFGRNLKKGSDSQTCDFGQLLIDKPDLAKNPQFSQDGPRPTAQGSSRMPQLPGAQQTTDPGIRQLIHNQQPLQTQAAY